MGGGTFAPVYQEGGCSWPPVVRVLLPGTLRPGSYKNPSQPLLCTLRSAVMPTFLEKSHAGQRAELLLRISFLKHMKGKLK